MTDDALPLAEAIQTAIEYETRVRDLYREAEDRATEDVGKRIFSTLAKEEQGHLDYLLHCQTTWQDEGKIIEDELSTVVPSPQRIAEGVATLESKLDEPRDWSVELELLRRALELERETGDFYRKMVAEIGGEGERLFRRFLEIEDGHFAIVQAEIDALTGTGWWFDSCEFSPEIG
jgi:rubrerythrin